METKVDKHSPILTDGRGNLAFTGESLVYGEQKINLSDVTSIKFGWLPISLDMFTIGGRYIVELSSPAENLRINLSYYLGLFKNRQRENFNHLLDAIWDLTVLRLLKAMVDEIDNGGTVVVGKCSITTEGISCKKFLIRWDDLSYQVNYNKLTLNSISNKDVWTNLYYTETHNVHVLKYFLEWKFRKTES